MKKVGKFYSFVMVLISIAIMENTWSFLNNWPINPIPGYISEGKEVKVAE